MRYITSQQLCKRLNTSQREQDQLFRWADIHSSSSHDWAILMRQDLFGYSSIEFASQIDHDIILSGIIKRWWKDKV